MQKAYEDVSLHIILGASLQVNHETFTAISY
jgi:hypothetical protein